MKRLHRFIEHSVLIIDQQLGFLSGLDYFAALDQPVNDVHVLGDPLVFRVFLQSPPVDFALEPRARQLVRVAPVEVKRFLRVKRGL